MENISTSTPPTSVVASLPHKSTLWSVGTIFVFLLYTSLGGLIVTFILLPPPLYLLGSYNPVHIYYASGISFVLNILGLWGGVSYVAKRSQIIPDDVAKISLWVGLMMLILNFFVSGLTKFMIIIAIAIEVYMVWALLKRKVK